MLHYLKPCIINNILHYFSKSTELVTAVHTHSTHKSAIGLCLGPYLNNPSLVHGTQYKKRIRRPFYVLNLVQASVQLKDLEGIHVPNDQSVLHTGSLSTNRNTAGLMHQHRTWEAPCAAPYNTILPTYRQHSPLERLNTSWVLTQTMVKTVKPVGGSVVI